MQVKNLLILLSSAALLSSCKGGGLFSKKKEQSEVTGWNYNDKNMGGYQVAKSQDQATGPGLVFVQGGTFTMGQTEEDIMGEKNKLDIEMEFKQYDFNQEVSFPFSIPKNFRKK